MRTAKHRIFAGLLFTSILLAIMAPGCGAGVPSAACGHHVPTAMRHFARHVMHRLGAPTTQANIASFNCWAHMEGSQASWNPLATTMPRSGATDFNSAGVKNYGSESQGVGATAATIENYPGIAGDFRSGWGMCGSQAELATWSGGGYSQVC